MKISNREKVFMAISLIIVIIVLYYTLFYKDLHREISGIKNDIQRNKRHLKDVSHFENQIKDLEENVNKLLAEAGQIPLNQKVCQVEPQIIVFLDDSIKHLGVGTRVKVKEVVEHEECYIITIILNFETSYDNLRGILSNIEKGPWPLVIDHIKTNKKQADSIDSIFDWDVETILRFFVFSQEKTL